jgi:hypothetical protein
MKPRAVEPFRHRLGGDVNFGKVRRHGCRIQSRERLLASSLGHPPFFHLAGQPFDDSLRARVTEVLRSEYVMSGTKIDMGNAMPHLSSAHYCNYVIYRFSDWVIFPIQS